MSRPLNRIATVRFALDEYLRLKDAAAERGMTLSALVRSAAIGAQIPGPRPARVDLEAVAQLRSIGTLLNQYLRVLHQEVSRENGKVWIASLIQFSNRGKDLQRLVDELKEGLT